MVFFEIIKLEAGSVEGQRLSQKDKKKREKEKAKKK